MQNRAINRSQMKRAFLSWKEWAAVAVAVLILALAYRFKGPATPDVLQEQGMDEATPTAVTLTQPGDLSAPQEITLTQAAEVSAPQEFSEFAPASLFQADGPDRAEE